MSCTHRLTAWTYASTVAPFYANRLCMCQAQTIPQFLGYHTYIHGHAGQCLCSQCWMPICQLPSERLATALLEVLHPSCFDALHLAYLHLAYCSTEADALLSCHVLASLTSLLVHQVGLNTGSFTAPDEHADSSAPAWQQLSNKAAKHSQHLHQTGCRAFPKFAVHETVHFP